LIGDVLDAIELNCVYDHVISTSLFYHSDLLVYNLNRSFLYVTTLKLLWFSGIFCWYSIFGFIFYFAHIIFTFISPIQLCYILYIFYLL
jgi:hypothetical protein